MENPDLEHLMREFLYLPSGYMDRSWLQDIMSEQLFAALSKNTRVQGRLNGYVIDRLALGFTASEPNLRWYEKFCLIPREVLTKVCRRIVLAQHSAGLSQIISGDEIRNLKRTLRDDDFTFLMHSAPLIVPQELAKTLPPNDELRDNSLVMRGLGMLSRVWQEVPDVFLNRARIKLPKHFEDGFSTASPVSINTALDEKQFLLRIIRETSPPWRVIFD